MGRRILFTGLELVGFAAIVAGVAFWSAQVAVILAGVFLIVEAAVVEHETRP